MLAPGAPRRRAHARAARAPRPRASPASRAPLCALTSTSTATHATEEGAGEDVPRIFFVGRRCDDTHSATVGRAPFNAHASNSHIQSVQHLRDVHAPRRRRRRPGRRRRGGGGGGAGCITVRLRHQRGACAGARVVPRLATQPAAARLAGHGGADALSVRRVGVAPRDAPRYRLLHTQQAVSTPTTAQRTRTRAQTRKQARKKARARTLCSAPMTLPFSARPFSAALIFARCSALIGRFLSPRRAASWRARSALEQAASSARMAVGGAGRAAHTRTLVSAACARNPAQAQCARGAATRLLTPAAAAWRPRMCPPSRRRLGRETRPLRCASSG
jgi:hypothetical protein